MRIPSNAARANSDVVAAVSSWLTERINICRSFLGPGGSIGLLIGEQEGIQDSWRCPSNSHPKKLHRHRRKKQRRKPHPSIRLCLLAGYTTVKPCLWQVPRDAEAVYGLPIQSIHTIEMTEMLRVGRPVERDSLQSYST